MSGISPVELTSDCPACGLEGGVIEVYDALVAACRFGLPSTTRCKLCGAASKGSFDRAVAKALREIPANRCPACLHELPPSAIDDRSCPSCSARAMLEETTVPATFTTIHELERALDLWAERETFASRHALAAATFVEPDIGKVFEALQRREPIETLADPFANMGMRTVGGSPRRKSEPHARRDFERTAPARASALVEALPGPAFASTDPVALPVPPLPLAPPPPSAPPRAIVYPLISVIAADGEIHPEERALIDRFLKSEGLPPLSDHEFRVHHPSEVAHFVPEERREEVVKLMCESAAVDGLPDESERRVIRAYATAWSVDDAKLEFWMWGYENMNTSIARQLFLKLRRFMLSARWGDNDARQW